MLVLTLLVGRDCRGSKTRWDCTIAIVAEPVLRGVLGVRFLAFMYGTGAPSENVVATPELGVRLFGVVAGMGPAVGSDGPGRDGRWWVSDGVWKPQNVSWVRQQLRDDCCGLPM